MIAPLTLDERKALRRKAWWTVADFARYTGVSHERGRRALLRYHAALGNTLLRASDGANRRYGFYWALLAAHVPEAFLDDPLESQRRLDALEELYEEIHGSLRSFGAQVLWITKEFERIKAARKRAA